ncbi:MAG TPA: hypothetical protein VFM63_14970 [Pyrinomonadaceae bacterium]|nr:hypothetical protein [Pyrinomonadaceae bacterium]
MKQVFRLLNEMVRDGAIPNYAIGGAIGAVFYVEPFATQDVDVFVMMETEPSGLVATIPGWTYLKARGYTEMPGEGIATLNYLRTLLDAMAYNLNGPILKLTT